ncbi:MAG TPA: hypothetical protein DCP31_33335, partial [Cyanobacteria bacterium UBA8543]|nr:hypothetical protein [Cyanobacteria bacterium UBA8543]
MCQRLSAYKQRGTAVFSGTVVQFEQEIVKEEAWAAYLETPLSAKTLLKEPKSKTKPLFPNSERNVGPPDTLTDDRPFAYMPPKKEKLSFEGLVREKLEFISKIGISKKGVYYIVYKTSRVTSCQFVSAAKLLKAFADIQKFRKGWDLTMNSMIACCDGKAVTMIKFIFTKAWEPEKLERTKIDVATLAPFLVDWSNRVNGFISPVKHVPLPNPTSKSTALKTPGIFQSKTARYKEECARSRERMIETRSEQWAMLAEIRKHPGLPEKLMELQSAAKKTGLKVGLGLSLQPFCASIVTQEGECLGNIALSIQSSFPWVVKMEDARRLATAAL